MVAARRLQRQIFVAGAVFGGRPQNGLGWLAGWLAGWAYKGAGCSAPKDSLPFGRGLVLAVGPQPTRLFRGDAPPKISGKNDDALRYTKGGSVVDPNPTGSAQGIEFLSDIVFLSDIEFPKPGVLELV